MTSQAAPWPGGLSFLCFFFPSSPIEYLPHSLALREARNIDEVSHNSTFKYYYRAYRSGGRRDASLPFVVKDVSSQIVGQKLVHLSHGLSISIYIYMYIYCYYM